ncbi:HDOD domain-containing protein [Pseudoduganella namucuonensis]|uniref:HDOD domain-containing protein n=1 Tax=Pseudoduganella namucuonensis TaxID=1035707 RepID=A0A1I7LK65_9BURK|nr:HDOD domain-containing protein [Pseudoduganella namucuonensis]SFV10084.1 HDOD domain-containing protein [Pseudoduganella namucuonensis]
MNPMKGPAALAPYTAEADLKPVRGALLKKLCSDENVFALGVSVARVVQLIDSDDGGTHDLAYFVLSDAALTQKVLRLANTPRFRTAAGTPVTTVSRAISLLGFDNVKSSALAMLLVDTLANSRHAQSIRLELEAALCASLVGREMARVSAHQGAEEASIGALFKNIGPLLVAAQQHERYREINALVAGGSHGAGQASQMILGSSYDALSAAILHEWKIPEVIVRSIGPLPPGPLKAPQHRQEWVRMVVSFSMEVARILGRGGKPSAAALQALLQRYGAALALDRDQLADLLGTVRGGMNELLDSLNMRPPAAPGGDDAEEGADGLPNVLLLAALDAGGGPAAGCHPSGKPYNARDQLLSGVQEVAQMRASGNSKLNELIQAVLETLYRGMGFRFATVCLRDMRVGQFRARIAFGEKHVERMAGFSFPLAGPDLFHLAMKNDADLMIADAGTPKIRALLPDWHRALLPDARSFIVLPLVVQGTPLGLFYADRNVPAPEGVPPDETALIRALKSQLIVALTPP